MMLRLLHFLTRHKYRVASCVYSKPEPRAALVGTFTEGNRGFIWGITVALIMCDCGKTKRLHLIGDHTGLKSFAELSELERIAKL